MQAPAPVSTPPIHAPPHHARSGRSGPAASAPAAPDRFTNALHQASVTPASDAQPQHGPADLKKGTQLTEPSAPPALPPASAGVVPVTGSVAHVGRDASNEPAAPVAETGQDRQPASDIQTMADAALPIAQPLLAPPIPIATAHVPTVPDSQGAAAPAIVDPVAALPVEPSSTPIATADNTSSTQEAGRPTPSAPPLTPRGLTQPETIGAAAHNSSSRPGTAPAIDDAAAIPAAIATDEAPVPKFPTAALIVGVPPLATAAPHVAAAPLALPRASARAGQSAAEQVGPALASFTVSTAQPGAPQHLTIRLDPADLGRVQLRIERTPGGPARVDVVIERPETLLLLLRDQPQLHRALELAGVPAADRTLQFHLAPPSAPAPGTAASQPNADPGSGQHRPAHSAQQRSFDAGRFGALDAAISRPAGTFRRAGVDITA